MKAPYLPYDEIRRISDEFLATYHPRLDLPMPIEMIVEQSLRLDVIPVRGLRYTQGRDGYLRLDRTGIVVDDQLFDPRYTTRYTASARETVPEYAAAR